MAQLVQIHQRIKAVETIKKITHAMRLISMSMHTRLKNREEPLKNYHAHLMELFKKIKSIQPLWHNSLFYPSYIQKNKKLIIIVGSQKGLCGNFNSGLFHFFERIVSDVELSDLHIIAIGKKADDYVKKKASIKNIIATYPNFTVNTLSSIVEDISSTILHATIPFYEVSIFSNNLKTFFIQKPQQSFLIPFATHQKHSETKPLEEFSWEHHPDEVLDALALQLFKATIEQLLFKSLLAEQAARFISMDSSTRNAKKIVEETILWYNKLRQDKITKELAELSGSF
jgi:F-type H+-transporting ATPase subunit gamma